MSLLKGLNSEQKQAVLHSHASDGPLLILAGAGSGKTSVLTKRILHRIGQGTPSSKILALTFTAKAAAEMDERVKELAPESQALLCTFHSLALRILKLNVGGSENWMRIGFKKVPTPKEQSSFEWQDSLMELGIKPGTLDREALFCPELKTKKNKLEKLKENVFSSGEIVFEDLIWLSIRLLSEFSEVREYCQNLWNEILIDEYQDINPSQYRLVRAILGNSKNLFAVGDDDQAIYGFRGADIGNILRFKHDFPDCRVLKLEWNYRSTPRILEAANRIFTDKPLSFRKNLRPGALRPYPLFKENRIPEVWVLQTAEEEIIKLAHEITFLKEEYSMKWSDFALLSRYNRQRKYYELALKECKIPIIEEDSPPDFDGVHIETIHASKGLQYAVVFYCGLAENLSPGELPKKRKEKIKQLGEEKRLFYVGVTRAEAHLIFLYCKQRYFKGQFTNFKESCFLKYCREKKFSKGIKMPIFVFKILSVIRIVFYMLRRIPVYFFQRIFKSSTVETWLSENFLSWAKLCLKTLRIDLNIKGLENLAKVDWSRPVIVIANHSSYADIPALLVSAQRPLGFLAKIELASIPILNYWMKKLGCVFIKRQATGAGQKFMDKISNYSPLKPPQIVIFPEGTRSKTGNMGSWKTGAFRMAAELKATILPIALQGTSQGWEQRKNSAFVQKATSQILEPFDVAEHSMDANALRSELRKIIELALDYK
ncbi:MAG: UvrD-helicase domain-containing protein [Fibromonadaceae bacterium]|jgi:1-acyl-sn-glycerol-3-phosphate acyltransferase|nr:UvrD-helicase domain-containing protein [Fibromonadaceae bacterium]